MENMKENVFKYEEKRRVSGGDNRLNGKEEISER